MKNLPTLHQLRLFEHTARTGNFGKAAESLHLTPPALSIQMRQLEETLGVALFDRIGRRKHLSSAGREVLSSCRNIFHELDDMTMRLSQLRGGMAGTIRISVVSSAKFFIPHLMGAFRQLYQGVEFQLTVANRAQIVARLADNLDDFVILSHLPSEVQVDTVSFLSNPLVVVAAPDHPLVKEPRIDLNRLSQEEFLLREIGSGTRFSTEAIFAEQATPLHCAMELGSSEAIKQGVMAGLGVSILSRHCVWMELQGDYLVELPVEGFPQQGHWYAVSLNQKKLSPVAQTFIDYLASSSEEVINGLEGFF
ncbi:MAG: LysR substrate-binding domain-containing protein [Motiliproteus sp.]